MVWWCKSSENYSVRVNGERCSEAVATAVIKLPSPNQLPKLGNW